MSTNTPLAAKQAAAAAPAHRAAGPKPAASPAPASTTPASTTSASTAAAASSSLGPGPRRFRGDVPAFNPSTPSPHIYNQNMPQYAQPPGSSPVYPARQPQYFAQQPQFMPYGGQVMQYYPVAMAYPDFSMYQPYQYYAMPAGQFPAQQAYVPVNMATGAGGYVPGRKKHFKSHNHHHNGHHQSSHGQGGSHHPYSKHASPTPSPNVAPDSGGAAGPRGADVNNSESVPRIDDSATSTSATITAPTSPRPTPPPGHSSPKQGRGSRSEDSMPAPTAPALKQVSSPAAASSSAAPSSAAPSSAAPSSAAPSSAAPSSAAPSSAAPSSAAPFSPAASSSVASSQPVESLATSPATSSFSGQASHPDRSSKDVLPLLLNITRDELISSRNAMHQSTKQLLESRSRHTESLVAAEPNRDYLVDIRRRVQIIDHTKGSEYETSLGAGLPPRPSKPNDNETNDSNASKPPLNWASLLQSAVQKPAKLKAHTPSNGQYASKPLPPSVSVAPTSTDRCQSLGLLVMSMLYDPAFDLNAHEPYTLKPRGLTNTGNICYMNAVLQCLIYCAPFNKTLRLVEEKSLGILGKSSTPVLDATIKFVNDFANVTATNKSGGSSTNSEGIVVGRPLSPESLYMKLVENPKFQHLKWGQQEDAEEFLVYLLDGLHEDFVTAEASVTADQMEQLISLYGSKLDAPHAQDLKTRMKNALRLVKHAENDAAEDQEGSQDEQSENGWSEVGGRRKVSSKRVSEVEPSPITSIFGGRFRSVLTVPKSKESHSITVDPYRCISLDISSCDVQTIEDALWKLNEVENLPYKTEGGLEVVAQKQTYIEDLPEVLTLQLKRFSFQQKQEQSLGNGLEPTVNELSHFHGVGKIEKVLKNISYGLDLAIPLESLSTAARHTQNRNYSLTGVIYHHGRNAEGGHYTCDVLRGDKKWLRIDDTAVEPINADAVTEKPEATDKSAYILIYQRKQASDT